MNRRKAVQIGRIILVFLFLFSGISKLLSMPFFDGMVMEFLIGDDYFDSPKAMWWTQVFTRILVAGELTIGLALLQNKWFKKWVMPALMAMLVLFTIHLFYEGFANPKGFVEGNCGCFGDVLPMTILESIIKNVVAIMIGVYVWMNYESSFSFKSWVAPTMLGLVSMFTLAFGIKSIDNNSATEPIAISTNADSDSTAETNDTTKNVDASPDDFVEQGKKDDKPQKVDEDQNKKRPEIELTVEPRGDVIKNAEDPNVDKDETDDAPSDMVVEPNQHTINLLQKFNSFSDGSKINFETGTSLVCMFSMSCSHCQEVYKEMCALSDQLPKTYLINYGAEFEQAYFFKQAGNCKHPYHRTESYPDFKRILEGSTYPRILVFKNGQIVRDWDVDTYSRASFMKYFGMKEPEKKSSGRLELETGGSPW